MSLGKFDSETEPCCIGASVLKVIQMGFELFAIYQSGPLLILQTFLFLNPCINLCFLGDLSSER